MLAALGQAHATRQEWRRASSSTRGSRAAPENTSHGASHAGGEPQICEHPAPLRAPAARAAPPGHTLHKARSTCARCSAAAVAPRYCQSPSGHAAAHPSTRATPSAPHTACAKPARCAGGGGGRANTPARRARPEAADYGSAAPHLGAVRRAGAVHPVVVAASACIRGLAAGRRRLGVRLRLSASWSGLHAQPGHSLRQLISAGRARLLARLRLSVSNFRPSLRAPGGPLARLGCAGRPAPRPCLCGQASSVSCGPGTR